MSIRLASTLNRRDPKIGPGVNPVRVKLIFGRELGNRRLINVWSDLRSTAKLIASIAKFSLFYLVRRLPRNEYKRIRFVLDTSTRVFQTGRARHTWIRGIIRMTVAKTSLAMLVLAGIVASSPAGSATLEVGPSKTYKTPSAAAAVAKNGDQIKIEPGQYFDCAVWNADNLVIEGTGPGVVITDKTCIGKGLFVIEGNNTTVRNLTLTRARVPDMNGAGIRLDKGNLTVDSVKFIDNQNGIMGGVPGTTVTIRNSDFDRNGTCAGACAHGIYIGDVDLLRVENSRFSNTRQAHSIKSRAKRTEVIGCNIADGPDGTSSYLIEAPNGGALIVRDTTLEKGPKSENHKAAIAIGAEGVTHPTPEITITNNNLRNDGNYETALVWNLTATRAILKGNKLAGSVIPLDGDGTVQ